MAGKPKLTAKAAIEQVLAENGGPMRVPEIVQQAVPLTALSGKTPGQQIYSVIYSEAKKEDGLFEKVGRGAFVLRRRNQIIY